MAIKPFRPLIAGALLAFIFATAASACQPGQLFAPRSTYAPTPTFPPFPQPTATITQTPAPTFTPAPPPIVETRQSREDTKTYSLALNYPYLDRISDPRFELFNEEVSATIDKIRQDFIDGMISNAPTPDPNLPPSFLQTTYDITHGDNGLLSVIFTVSYYVSGAAHPNQYAVTLNLDIANARLLQLKDLFKPAADYLQFISNYCIQDLKQKNVLEWDTGVLPEEENFHSWNITPEGLLFSFDPYVVAAYALGPQSVTIPYSALKDILDPSGPLAPILH